MHLVARATGTRLTDEIAWLLVEGAPTTQLVCLAARSHLYAGRKAIPHTFVELPLPWVYYRVLYTPGLRSASWVVTGIGCRPDPLGNATDNIYQLPVAHQWTLGRVCTGSTYYESVLDAIGGYWMETWSYHDGWLESHRDLHHLSRQKEDAWINGLTGFSGMYQYWETLSPEIVLTLPWGRWALGSVSMFLRADGEGGYSYPQRLHWLTEPEVVTPTSHRDIPKKGILL